MSTIPRKSAFDKRAEEDDVVDAVEELGLQERA